MWVVYIFIGLTAVGIGVVIWALAKRRRAVVQRANEPDSIERPHRIKWSLLLLIWNIALSIALVWGFLMFQDTMKTATVQQEQTTKTLRSMKSQLSSIESDLRSMKSDLWSMESQLSSIESDLRSIKLRLR